MDDLLYRNIKKLAIDVDIKFKDLAIELGVSPKMINNVITGRSVSARVQMGIARRLHVPVRKLFPNYKPARKQKEAANG